MTERALTDLPEPDSPTSAKVSPRAISKLTFRTARTGVPGTSNSTERSRIDRSGGGGLGAYPFAGGRGGVARGEAGRRPLRLDARREGEGEKDHDPERESPHGRFLGRGGARVNGAAAPRRSSGVTRPAGHLRAHRRGRGLLLLPEERQRDRQDAFVLRFGAAQGEGDLAQPAHAPVEAGRRVAMDPIEEAPQPVLRPPVV